MHVVPPPRPSARGRGHRRSRLVAAALATLSYSAAASATTSHRLGLDGLLEASSVVVHGRALAQESRLERGRMYTSIRFEVLEAVGANTPSVIEVRVPGGAVPVPGRSDGLVLVGRVAGAPEFRIRGESVLFLSAAPAASTAPGSHSWYRVVGLAQGKLDVAADGTVDVMRGLPAGADGGARSMVARPATGGSVRVSVGSFLAELRGRVRKGA
jgi:hypothetical protein